MFKKQLGNSSVPVLLALAIVVAMGYGWVMNIVSLVQATGIAGMEIARIAGIFVAPLGAVLGYF